MVMVYFTNEGATKIAEKLALQLLSCHKTHNNIFAITIETLTSVTNNKYVIPS